ncbi:hypothetical protein ACFLYX_00165 [Chloroflexota bacterium]
MNWLILISGIVALSAAVGHLTMGRKMFLEPMLAASFDDVPKKVMHAVFHYVSVYQILSSVALLSIGAGFSFDLNSTLLIYFIALNYSLFALSGIIIALTSGIPNSLMKMFQWVFWVVIAVLAWLGA